MNSFKFYDLDRLNRRTATALLALFSISAGIAEAQEALLARLEGADQQVRVEAQDPATGRWLAVASGYREHSEDGWLKMRLPEGTDINALRVLVNDAPSPFAGQIRSANVPDEIKSQSLLTPGFLSADGNAEGDLRSVDEPDIEESDIWAVRDNRLYFFNQYRGLQVIDILESGAPQMVASYRYPARGESLYVLADGRVLLISNGGWSDQERVELSVLAMDGNELQLQQQIDVGLGHYLDSRRYGNTLYIATREWLRPETATGINWSRPLVRLHSLSLDGEVAAADEPMDFLGEGYYDVVLDAQPGALLLATVERSGLQERLRTWRSVVHVLEPDSDGKLHPVGTALTVGVIRDKFKMRYADGLLTTVSQQVDFNSFAFNRTTRMENFRLNDGNEFERIGVLDLAPGETLFATRFYGDTIYVVTFLMVDPLFAIDNSQPAQPKVVGELKIPGWSDYIEWVDGYLFAIGPEDNRLSVSQFDVSNPADMKLVDREYLSEDSWASSEAQYNDKAISFFPGQKLFVLPFMTWAWDREGPITALQVVGWNDEGLSLHGSIQHVDTPRRGFISGDLLVSVSGNEIVTTNIADPALPQAVGKLRIAWSVDELIAGADFAVQLEGRSASGYSYFRGYSYGGRVQSGTTLFVTDINEPNHAIASLALGSGQLIGAHLSGDKLQVLLSDPESYPENWWELPLQQIVVAVNVDLANPAEPQLEQAGGFTLDGYLSESLQSHPLSDGSVLWTADAANYYAYAFGMIDIAYRWMPSGSGFIITQSDPVSGSIAVVHASVDATADWKRQAFSFVWQDPFLVRSVSLWHEDETQPPQGSPQGWTRHELEVVDLSIPAEPLQLKPVRIPSALSAADLQSPTQGWLYLNTAYNKVAVWGWDGASAFELLEQEFPHYSSEGMYRANYSVEWMPPFNLRGNYSWSTETEYSSSLQSWWHDRTANRLVLTKQFDSIQWAERVSAQLPEVLVYANGQLYNFNADPASGVFALREQFAVHSSLGWQSDLDQTVFSSDKLWIPFGAYGVEVFERTPLEVPARSLRKLSATVASEWRELARADWMVVTNDGDDKLGRLNKSQWLYSPDTMVPLDATATDAGDLWRNSSWFGYYVHLQHAPQAVYHVEHGNIGYYLLESGGDAGVFLFDAGLGFLWTRDDLYPWLYSVTEETWLHYEEGTGASGTRWFWNTRDGWNSARSY